MEKYIDMMTGKTIKVVKRTGDTMTVIIDGIVSHMSVDYMMENCKKA